MPLILFLLSFLVLSLEVLETKIFAYSLANTLIFLVVGVVLLGFGAGGTVLSLRRELVDPRPLVRKCLLLTAVLLVFAHAWFAVFSDQIAFGFHYDISNVHDIRELVGAVSPLIVTVSVLVLLAAPYFTAGMAVSAMLAEGNVHLRYGVNLLGSALGCVSIFFVLGPLTGPECLVACAILAALLAVPLSERKLTLLAFILVLGVPCFVFANRLLPYQMQKAADEGQLALIIRNAQMFEQQESDVQSVRIKQEFDRWDPTARVQVHSLEVETSNAAHRSALDKLPSMWFTQDSSYGSPLLGRGVNPDGAEPAYSKTCYGVGYFRDKSKPDVLIVGLGGAPDVQTALFHDPAHIDGVDINRTTVAMVKSDPEISGFLGKPYDDPRFEAHIRDGRSFVRASDDKYDLIQLSGVDTKSILSSGTLALNESYLYTREAFGEYLDHLKDDGILCILYAGDPLRDRFAVTAMEVLVDKFGSEEPETHLMMVEQGAIFCFLVKRTPFTKAECAQMDAWLAAATAGGEKDGEGNPITGVVVMMYELLNPGLSLNTAPKALWVPDGRKTDIEVMQAALEGRGALRRYVDGLKSKGDLKDRRDLSPAPDSRPFFFNILTNDQVFARVPGSEGFHAMFGLIYIMLALSVLLITGPLMVFGVRGVGRRPGAGEEAGGLFVGIAHAFGGVWSNVPAAAYFAALGTGFIFAMSGLIQRYVLFLGHQAYAFSVVIGGLLVAAGCGSMLTALFKRSPRVLLAVAVLWICVALGAIQFYLDQIFGRTAELSMLARIGIAVGVLFPLGVPLGMMFPTGLGVVKRASPLFVPWAFGINGVFSVIGSTVVLPGAVLFGFPTMAIAAGAVYLFAGIVGWWMVARADAREREAVVPVAWERGGAEPPVLGDEPDLGPDGDDFEPVEP